MERVLEEIKQNNPYGLVLKGGTALALHHQKNHRESEDLDFDVDKKHLDHAEDIASFITAIFEKLINDGFLEGYEVRKKGFAHKNRYHMNITFVTYKDFYSKVDLDFVDLPEDLEYEGDLGFYKKERMFAAKLLTYKSRKELKDIFDISHLLSSIESHSFKKPEKVALLIDDIIEILNDRSLIDSYKKSFRSIDLRFRKLKEPNIEPFIDKTQHELRIFRNALLKKGRPD